MTGDGHNFIAYHRDRPLHHGTERAQERMAAQMQQRMQERADALTNLRRALECQLTVTSPRVHEGTIAQFRADLLALGVSPAELDAAGIPRPA